MNRNALNDAINTAEHLKTALVAACAFDEAAIVRDLKKGLEKRWESSACGCSLGAFEMIQMTLCEVARGPYLLTLNLLRCLQCKREYVWNPNSRELVDVKHESVAKWVSGEREASERLL